MNTIQTKILSKKSLTHDVIELLVQPLTPVTFKPGQFMNLVCKDQENKTAIRSYSIANTAQDYQKGHLRFVIKLLKNGAASSCLINSTAGDTLDWLKPGGIFTFKSYEAKNVYLFATGTGIAPLMAMIEDALKNDYTGKIKLFFGLRYKVDIFWEDRLNDLAEHYGNFDYLITLSKPVGYWDGAKGYVTQFVSDQLNYEEGHFYLCGLPNMVEEVKKLLTERGVDKNRIFEEKYSNPRMKS